jgi:uncharacterized membrane protein
MTITDERMERIIANLLRTGVSLSAAVVCAGGLCYLVHHGGEPANYRTFSGESLEYRSVAGIIRGVVRLDCRAIIQFGLLILIATPVARVAFSIAAFALERDRTYVVVTAIVLAILLFSLIVQP